MIWLVSLLLCYALYSLAFDGAQHRAQGTVKFQLLSLASRGIGQQRQLLDPSLKLRGRFGHRRASG